MVDSEELFYTMFQNNYMLKSSFILFFNKKDLFEDKLKHVDLKQFFPTYQGKIIFMLKKEKLNCF